MRTKERMLGSELKCNVERVLVNLDQLRPRSWWLGEEDWSSKTFQEMSVYYHGSAWGWGEACSWPDLSIVI